MTLVIGFVSEKYSLIASDTKITYANNILEPTYRSKLVSLSGLMGWSSGTGLGQFLDRLKEKLKNKDISNINNLEKDVMVIFNTTVKEFLNDGYSKNDIYRSAISFSTACVINGEIFNMIGYISEKWTKGELYFIDPNSFHLMYPDKYSQENIDKFTKKYKLENVNNNINSVLIQTLEMFNEISKASSENVSRECEIGLQYIDNDIVHKRLLVINMDDYENGKNDTIKDIRIDSLRITAPN